MPSLSNRRPAPFLKTGLRSVAALLLAGVLPACGGGDAGTVSQAPTEQRALEIPDAWQSDYHGIFCITVTPDLVAATRTYLDDFEVTPNSIYDGRAHWYAGGTHGYPVDNQPYGGGDDAVLVKYGDGGSRIWARYLGGTGDDLAYGVASDGDNVVFVAGATDSPSFDGQATRGGRDLFLARYDGDGNRMWTRLLGGSGDDAARCVGLDGAGNVFVAGATTSTDLGQPPGASGSAILLAKYDAPGNRLWVRLFGGTGDEVVQAMQVDGRGDFYITGSTGSPVLDNQVNPGGTSAFLAKYDTDGNRLWTRIFGGTGNDAARAVAVDNAGNVFIGGYSFSRRVGEWLNFASVASDNVSADAFLARYDAAGNLAWSRLLGSASSDLGAGVRPGPDGTIGLIGFRNCDSLDLAGNFHVSLGQTHFLATFAPDGTLLNILSSSDY